MAISEASRLLFDSMNDMQTIYVESSLNKPLDGLIPVEVNQGATVRQLVTNFLFALERQDGIPGLEVYDKNNKKLDWEATLESQGIVESSLVKISYHRTISFRPIHIGIIGATSIIIACIFIVCGIYLFAYTGGDVPFDYGIVIDAGSTHTEVFLYQWSGSKYLGTGEVKQKDHCLIEMGIAEGYDPIDIISCVNNLTTSVPSENTSPVELYLRATAGMRLLNASSPFKAQLILTAIKYALKTTSFKESSVEIIEGQEEGLLSWITANFLSKTLINNSENTTFGALDLGGGSTQLAFDFNNFTNENLSDIKYIKLYGKSYSVLAQSFLCFGLSKAADRNEAIIFMNNTTDGIIIDPCLPANFSRELETRRFLEGPCIQNKNLTSWFENNGSVKKLTVIGSSNYDECVKSVKKLVNPDECKSMGFKPCLKPIHMAVQDKKFMAFSSFYYIVDYLNPNGSLSDFMKATQQFCSLSYEEIKHKAKDKELLFHLLQYCFGAVYIKELLTSVYGFTDSTWENINFLQNIDGADVGWALGFMINATNAIPEEKPSPSLISLSVFIPVVVIAGLMILCSIILFGKYFNCDRNRHRELLLDNAEVPEA